MTNQVYADVLKHFEDPKARIVVAVQGGYSAPVFAPKDAAKIKPEGSGLRIGKLFVFACQVRFAHVK